VWKFLRRYGVNPYVFAGVEFTSAAIYGKSSAQVVGAVIDGAWKRIRSWLPLALLTYFAPDGYVLLSAGRLPSDMLAILLAMVCVTLVLTGVGIWSQIRRGRRALFGLAHYNREFVKWGPRPLKLAFSWSSVTNVTHSVCNIQGVIE
jgi:hypothetical protein